METKSSYRILESGVIVLVRLSISTLMIHHGLEKLSDPQGFTSFIIDKYFDYLPLNHLYWTYLAAYTQLIASGLVIFGFFFRPALISLSITMVFALVFHFLDSGLQGAPFAIVEAHNYEYETSSLYLIAYLTLMVSDAGQFSVKHSLSRYIPENIRWLA